jgi:hypothetical protein
MAIQMQYLELISDPKFSTRPWGKLQPWDSSGGSLSTFSRNAWKNLISHERQNL